MRVLKPVPISREAFAPFGEVIDIEGARQIPINQGLTTRFHDLLTPDCDTEGGHSIVSLFRTDPLPLPHTVAMMERHPLGSQAFIPMDADPFLVLVAPAGNHVNADDLLLFRTRGGQGVNYCRGTWHHFQIVTGRRRDFIVIDRSGPGNNLEECALEGEAVIPEDVMEIS